MATLITSLLLTLTSFTERTQASSFTRTLLLATRYLARERRRRERDRERQREKDRKRETDRKREIEREKETEREKERERDRERYVEIYREREKDR